MATPQATHINAYRAEAVEAQARLQAAQGEADVALQAYVDKGGDRADIVGVEQSNQPKDANVKLSLPKGGNKKPAASKDETPPADESKPADESAPDESKPAEVQLPDEFKDGDVAYKAERAANGKVYKYTKDGETVKKVEYAKAYDKVQGSEA